MELFNDNNILIEERRYNPSFYEVKYKNDENQDCDTTVFPSELRSFSLEIGLEIKSLNPACRNFSLSPGNRYAVIAITGTSSYADIVLIILSTSKPL